MRTSSSINPYGLLFDEITASSLVKINTKGDDARRYAALPSTSRPSSSMRRSTQSSHDAACVLHTHSDASVAVSGQEKGLLPLSQFAMRFYERQAVPRLRGRRHRPRRAGAAGARSRPAQGHADAQPRHPDRRPDRRARPSCCCIISSAPRASSCRCRRQPRPAPATRDPAARGLREGRPPVLGVAGRYPRARRARMAGA